MERSLSHRVEGMSVEGMSVEGMSVEGMSGEEGRTLLEVAAAAVEHGLSDEAELRVDPSGFAPPLDQTGGSFVSLHRETELLGCVGTLEPSRPLICDVAFNAHGAAFRDPRLPSVTPADFSTMTIDVAVVGPLVPVVAGSYDELIDGLDPEVDGIVVSVAKSRATFLPAVWAQLPEPEQFLAALWAKAGLDRLAWPRDIRIDRYRTRVFASAATDLDATDLDAGDPDRP